MTAAAKPDSTAAMEHKLVPYYSRLGYALAARVLQSDLYRQLDDVERAQCDELLAAAPSRQPANAELSDAVFCKLCSAVITDEDLRIRIKPTHEAADAFWKHWRENGETHKHGYYESTWGAINAALNAQPNALSLDKRGIRQQGGEPHDVAEFYKDDAAEQRTAAQQGTKVLGQFHENGDGTPSGPKKETTRDVSDPAASAPLSREQIEDHIKYLAATGHESTYRIELARMALRYRDLLEQEPVAWRYKPKSGEKWWLTGGPPEGVDGWDIEKLIVAPVAQVPGVAG